MKRAILIVGAIVAVAIPASASAASLAQKNAVAAAKQYLQVEAFSKLGLIGQLDSKDGSGFSKTLAVYAVSHISVNWNTEAVKAAKNYLKTEPFSCSGLVQQLDSPDGSQFTKAQAEYGAKKAGIC
jgi:hypothetical protein